MTDLNALVDFTLSDARALEQEEHFKRLAALITSPEKVVVASPEQEIEARQCYALIDAWIKGTEGELEAALAPLKAAVKEIGGRLKPALQSADARLRMIESGLRAWKQEQDRLAKAEQDRQNKLHEKRVERAEASGKDPAAVAPPPVVAAPVKTADLGDQAQTWVDNWVGYLGGVPLEQCKDLTRADFQCNGFTDNLFKFDVATVQRSIKAGKGFSPFASAANLVVKNEPYLATRRK